MQESGGKSLCIFLSFPDLLLHLQLAADAVKTFEGIVAGEENLVAVDQTGHDEAD